MSTDTHLTGDPADATDTNLVNALGGLCSRIARVPSDPNGSQANDLHQMREDLDRVRAEVLTRMGAAATGATESGALRLDVSGPAMFSSEPQRWAVARLDDGSEVRMRACGDRVEVRTWDATESCSPPALDVERVGRHVLDVRVPKNAEVYVVTTALGMTESFTEQNVKALVALGLIEHERDDYVTETGDGHGVGPLHHFYREVKR